MLEKKSNQLSNFYLKVLGSTRLSTEVLAAFFDIYLQVLAGVLNLLKVVRSVIQNVQLLTYQLSTKKSILQKGTVVLLLQN